MHYYFRCNTCDPEQIRAAEMAWILLAICSFTCIALQVVNCCNYFPYDDPRCYLELVNGRYLVRANAAGTYMDFHTCNIALGEITSQQNHHTHECDRTLHFGEIFYVSSASSTSSSGHTSSSSSRREV
ncbi:uncharacterized protein LOC144625328 isoform X1 [Crassostrea virginica]